MTVEAATRSQTTSPYDIEAIRRDFPILAKEVYGKPLVYLDNGASAQKPRQVIERITYAYENEYANVVQESGGVGVDGSTESADGGGILNEIGGVGSIRAGSRQRTANVRLQDQGYLRVSFSWA